MADAIGYAIMVTLCFVIAPIALTRGPMSIVGAEGVLSRYADWALAHRRDEIEEDEAVVQARLRQRWQELTSTLDRLRGLLLTDTAMSATRQLGNRIAYRQVLRDLRALPTIEVLPRIEDLARAGVVSGPLKTAPGRPDVEILDICWR